MHPLRAPLPVVFLLTACANTGHGITGMPRPPIDPAEVKVYSTAPPGYAEIAVIDASSRSSFAPDDQKKVDAVVQRRKKEAAALGANGVRLQIAISPRAACAAPTSLTTRHAIRQVRCEATRSSPAVH